jgi:FkbM family methyltransferase
MTAGSSLRTRRGAVRQVTVWEGGDVSNVWSIFGADEYLVRDTDTTIVDVGANVGLFALYAAQTAPRARIYCFEPLPQNFDRLQLQIESAGVRERVTCFQLGLAGESGTRKLFAPGGGDVATLIATDADGESHDVTVLSLAEALERVGHPQVSMLKLDCEGAEREILTGDGATEALRRVRRVCVEYHPTPACSDPEARIIALLRDGGFSVLRQRPRPGETGVVWCERSV